MTSAIVGHKTPTIKPDDLVRTEGGGTAVCIEIRPRGFRLLRDVVTGFLFSKHVDDLYLVRASTPRPWPAHRLP